MKSFSSNSFAGDATELLARARAAVKEHPQALFTNFQWFLFEGRDTVFFTAATSRAFDRDSLNNVVAEMVTLAPQLTHGFVGARPGEPFPKHLLEAITSLEYVDEFDGYPDKWLGKSHDIFDRDDLPLFRVMAVVRKGGPDALGRSTMIQVRSSHALMEGSDSALLTRSQPAAHGLMSDSKNKISWFSHFSSAMRALGMTTMFLGVAHLMAQKERPWGFKTLAIKRHRLRLLANRLGVRQRSLMFALVTHALNGDGPEKHMSKRVIGANYTMLDTKRQATDDDFFRVRALEAKFQVNDDFLAFVREVDSTIGAIEQKDITKFQVVINSMFATLRWLHRSTGGLLPGRRFWRFNPPGHNIVLTLVPPHRTYGPMTHGMMEPIYCGAWHFGANICTFCPGREYVTLNFSMEKRHVDNVDKIMSLLERVEAMDITPPPRKVLESAAE